MTDEVVGVIGMEDRQIVLGLRQGLFHIDMLPAPCFRAFGESLRQGTDAASHPPSLTGKRY